MRRPHFFLEAKTIYLASLERSAQGLLPGARQSLAAGGCGLACCIPIKSFFTLIIRIAIVYRCNKRGVFI